MDTPPPRGPILTIHPFDDERFDAILCDASGRDASSISIFASDREVINHAVQIISEKSEVDTFIQGTITKSVRTFLLGSHCVSER
jgi:hypothetical protein